MARGRILAFLRWTGAQRRPLRRTPPGSPPEISVDRLREVFQPALLGLIDGTLGGFGFIWIAAFLAGPATAFMIGLGGACASAISMAVSEGLSDTGERTGRGRPIVRAVVTGGGTAVGIVAPTCGFLAPTLSTALGIAGTVLVAEVVLIAVLRRCLYGVSFARSLVHVGAGVCLAALPVVAFGAGGG